MKADATLARVRRQRLADLCTLRSQKAIADLSGISLSQIGQWLGGDRNMTEGSARRIERAALLPIGWLDSPGSFDVDASYAPANAKAQPLSLAAGSIASPDTDGAMTMRLPRAEADSIGGGFALAASAAPPDGYVRLSVLGEAAAGAGRMAIDSAEIVPQIDVLESWIRTALRANPARLRVLTARGHSMPGVAEDGDVMFVEPCTTFETDGIYVLTVGELLRVKRLRLRLADRQISIESTDGSAPEMVPVSRLDDDIRIQGRVVGAWTLRRF
jgi:transcriptional regulator with XRE-family HTH domain